MTSNAFHRRKNPPGVFYGRDVGVEGGESLPQCPEGDEKKRQINLCRKPKIMYRNSAGQAWKFGVEKGQL